MFCEFIQHEGYIECTVCRRTLHRTETHYTRTCRTEETQPVTDNESDHGDCSPCEKAWRKSRGITT